MGVGGGGLSGSVLSRARDVCHGDFALVGAARFRVVSTFY